MDFNAGDVVGHLKLDVSAWQRSLQQAQQQLQQFGQQGQQHSRQAAQAQAQAARAALQAQVQAGREALQAAQHAAQGQTQAARAALQAQVQAGREALQAAQQRFQAETQAARQAFQAQQQAARQAAQEQAQAARGASSIISTALGVAGGLGLVTSLSGIASGLKSLATEAIQAASRMESLRAQFTALQGESRAAVTLQSLFTTAQRLGVEFGTLATAFRQFDAATQGTALEGAKAQRVFEQITTGMRAMGASSEQVGRALLALQQMVSKGTVSQEELRQQLGEAMPGAMGIAARAFGVTTQEMNKMIEKGMEATSFVQTFGNQVEREFAGKATTATNTLASAWQRFSNELEQFKGALAGGELVGQLRDLANWAAKFLETLRQSRELQQERLGGAAPAIPPEMVGMRTLEARQKEIEALRRTVVEEGRNLPGVVEWGIFGGKTREEAVAEARARLQDLQKVQADAIKRMQDQWAAETEQPLVVPGARQAEALRKIQEDLQKQLRDLDLTADFVTPLELAEARLKAIEDAFKRMREIVPQIGEGLRHTLIPSGKPSPYDAMFEAAAAKYGLNPNVLRALGEQESELRPEAVSPKGARGIMQIMPGTAAQYGGAGKNLLDAATNIDLGAKIFADLMQRFNNDVTKALTAYNAGPGRGGIPLPTGENATFARDVLRRLPRQPGDVLAQTEAQRRAAELGVEAEKPDLERRRQTFETGKAYLQALEEEERQADAAARERRQHAFATGQEYIRALEQEIAKQEQAMETLRRLESAYTQTKEARDEDTAAALAAQFPHNEEIQTAASRVQALAQTKAAYDAEVTALRERFTALKQNTDAMREAEAAEAAFSTKIEQTIVQLRAPRTERQELRLRAEAQRQGVAITPEQEAMLQEITVIREQQERLNYAVDLYGQLADGVGSAWVSALGSIADHTKTVGEAFREMGRSILQTMAQIAAQEATRALFQLGAGLLTGALMPSAPAGPFANPGGFEVMFQHGGIVNRPTRALVGENPAHNPEWILNRQQMQGLMSSAFRGGPSAGGQAAGGGIAIFNFPSKAAAEQEMAQQRALGREIVLNEVMSDLSRGEASSINRMIRTLSR